MGSHTCWDSNGIEKKVLGSSSAHLAKFYFIRNFTLFNPVTQLLTSISNKPEQTTLFNPIFILKSNRQLSQCSSLRFPPF
jgi:hypothetical protein